MTLATMRFAGYEWRYNPLTLKITDELSHKKLILPSAGEIVADPRVKVRVISGKGEFAGEDCIDRYKELERIFFSGKKGVLTLPQREPVYAYFTRLAAEATDTPELIVYSFEFVEETTKQNSKEPEYHICNGWENLYTIAYDYKVSLEKIVELNPWIKRPDEQLAGKRVRLC